MKEWRRTTLGEVCHVYQPETLSQKQLDSSGTFPVFGANGQIGWHSEYNHQHAQLVLGCRGSCGSVHITPAKCWINGNAMVVEPKLGVLRDFLAYALRGGIDIDAAISGTAQPQITRRSLTPIPISLPADPAEQQRIVGILDAAFAGIAAAKANAEKNLRNARELFESGLSAALSAPNGKWARATLDAVVTDDCTLSYGIVQPGDEVPDGLPIVRPVDLNARHWARNIKANRSHSCGILCPDDVEGR